MEAGTEDALGDVPAWLLEQEQRFAARTGIAKLTKEQTEHVKLINRVAERYEAFCKASAPLLLRLTNEENGSSVVPMAQRSGGDI